MRIARKLILLVFTAIAAMALAAGAASAQEVPNSIDLRSEATGAVCNPCEVTLEGEAHIIALPSGVRVSQCSNNFHVRAYGSVGGNPARGEIEWAGANDNPPPDCTVVNCASPENHWSATNFGSLGGGVGHFTVRFCLGSAGPQLHCNAEITVSVNPTTHSYMYSAIAICAGGARRIEGEASSDSTGIEVVLL